MTENSKQLKSSPAIMLRALVLSGYVLLLLILYIELPNSRFAAALPDDLLPPALQRFPALNAKQVSWLNTQFAIYVINMDRDQQRLESIGQKLKAQNLQFTRIKAIDGQQYSKHTWMQDQRFSQGFLQVATRGELGCVLSHRQTWQQAQQARQPYILVIEDDLQIGQDFAARLYQLARKISQANFDVLFIGRDIATKLLCRQQQWQQHKFCIHHNNPNLVKKEPKLSWSSVGFAASPYSGGAFAYIIPHASLGKLIQAYSSPIHAIADREWWNPQHQLKMLSVVPLWFTHQDHASSHALPSRSSEF